MTRPTRILEPPFYLPLKAGGRCLAVTTDVGVLTLTECARRVGLHQSTLSHRLSRMHYADETIFTRKGDWVDPTKDNQGGGNASLRKLSRKQRSHKLAAMKLGTWELAQL